MLYLSDSAISSGLRARFLLRTFVCVCICAFAHWRSARKRQINKRLPLSVLFSTYKRVHATITIHYYDETEIRTRRVPKKFGNTRQFINLFLPKNTQNAKRERMPKRREIRNNRQTHHYNFTLFKMDEFKWKTSGWLEYECVRATKNEEFQHQQQQMSYSYIRSISKFGFKISVFFFVVLISYAYDRSLARDIYVFSTVCLILAICFWFCVF